MEKIQKSLYSNLKRICKDKYIEKSHMIPNGYDLKDKPQCIPISSNNKFVLTYVGALYGGYRDLSPVFKAIYEIFQGQVNLISVITFTYI